MKPKRAAPQGPFLCYALTDASERRSYTGQTNCWERRIRQHNGQLAGGARYTSRKSGAQWRPLFKVHGFVTLKSVLSFEWAMKKRRGPRARSGPAGRIRQLEHILSFGTRYTNARDNWVECHVSQQRYLQWSGLSATQFEAQRAAQGVQFKFVC
jgi:predicted GIY-YIG superfamily endonuclease